jgi:putative transposase
MKKSLFSEEQIGRILKEVEAGAKVSETCRKHGISEPTYYVWKTKFAGMEVSQLRHLKDVEAELARLKRMRSLPPQRRRLKGEHLAGFPVGGSLCARVDSPNRRSCRS